MLLGNTPTGNRLLAGLPGVHRTRVLAGCEPVELLSSQVLAEPGDTISDVYFPTQSFISLRKPVQRLRGLEVGLIGDEGMLGASLLLGVPTSALGAVVQGEGLALRMDAAAFLDEVARSPALDLRLKRYLYVLLGQLAQTAACARYHLTEARLARWLLMTQDRAHSRSFHVTHRFLTYTLGVRRQAVTKAASTLQRLELISYSRGNVKILNRSGLMATACECYAADKRSYEQLMA